MKQGYTPADILKAYTQLTHAQELAEFVIQTDAMDGSAIAIFSIINDYMDLASSILDDLNMGYGDKFSALWKNKEGAA